MPRPDKPPAEIHELRDDQSGLHAFIVLHDLTRGPAFGGIRCRSYPSEAEARDDAIELARQMTWKCALAELPAGGGKGVILADRLKDRRLAYQILGDFVESLGGRFCTAGDLGTGPSDLRELGARSRYVAREEDLGDLGDASAIGIVAAMEALVPHDPSSGRRIVAVQGVGEIGAAVARRAADGGFLVLVGDLDAQLADRVARAISSARRDRTVVDDVDDDAPRDLAAARPPVAVATAAETLMQISCDVLAPCAVGGVIDPETAGSIATRAVVGGANRILSEPRAGEILFARGIRYAPDFVANAGAVIRGARFMLAGVPAADDEIRQIGPRVASIWNEAVAVGRPPEHIAMERARARVSAK